MNKNYGFFRTSLLLTVLTSLFTMSMAQDITIIPRPNEMAISDGFFPLSGRTVISYESGCNREASLLQEILLKEHGLKVNISLADSKSRPGVIRLGLSPEDSAQFGKEGYSLQISRDRVTVKGATDAGVFYALQSLRQIIRTEGKNKVVAPCLQITDKPRFGWRAFMLDEARHFKGTAVVKELLDEMALMKLNTFHWHLTDDQGWRIEILKYPLLTQVGGTRQMTETGTWNSNTFDSTLHTGYYTQQQIKEIIDYASERHIAIIPEIEMPGHASAAIASYPWLGTTKEKIEVVVRFGINSNVYNVASPQVNQFLQDVLREVMDLFPSQIIHIGGDEVKYDQWKESKDVTAFMKRNAIGSYADLQIFFTNSISNYLARNDHRMMGWNEIMGGHFTGNDSIDSKTAHQLSPNTIVHFWTGDPGIVNDAVAKGYEVVNSFYEFTYLDYTYETTSLQKAYGFDPVPATLSAGLENRILGLGCQMWSEWIPTVERMNYQIYPRIAAHAETGWTRSENKDYSRFLGCLKNSYLMDRWKRRNISFSPEQF